MTKKLILTERPAGMPYEEFKALRAKQNRQIKNYLRWGKQVHTAVVPRYTGEKGKEKLVFFREAGTYKKPQS